MTPPAKAQATPAADDDRDIGASPVPQQRLRERDFALLFTGLAATATGTAVVSVALPLVANALPITGGSAP